SVIRRRLDVNFLMTVAAFGAFAIGQADEGAAVMYLFSLAEYLEDVASGKVRSSIAGLLKLSPSSATLKVDGLEVEKHIHDVRVGAEEPVPAHRNGLASQLWRTRLALA